MARRKDHTPDEFRALAIDAAIGLIGANGLAALSARALGQAIGYVPGTLYNHFDNLEAVAFAASLHTLDRLDAALNASIVEDASAATTLRALGDAYVRFVSDNPKLWDALFQLDMTEAQRDQLRGRAERTMALVGNVLGQLAPTLPDAEKQRYVLLLWSGMQGICAVISDDPDSPIRTPPRTELVQLLVDTLIARFATLN